MLFMGKADPKVLASVEAFLQRQKLAYERVEETLDGLLLGARTRL